MTEKEKPTIEDHHENQNENIDDFYDDDFYEDSVADWELLGLDPDTPQDEIDKEWENQM